MLCDFATNLATVTLQHLKAEILSFSPKCFPSDPDFGTALCLLFVENSRRLEAKQFLQTPFIRQVAAEKLRGKNKKNRGLAITRRKEKKQEKEGKKKNQKFSNFECSRSFEAI